MHQNKSTQRIDLFGNKIWQLPNGHYHKIDGPAYEGKNGSKVWYSNHKLHRVDGPAIERPNDQVDWYINDKEITNEVEKWLIENNYVYPFNEEILVEFKLKFL